MMMMSSPPTTTAAAVSAKPSSITNNNISSGGSGSFQRLVAIPQEEYNQLSSIYRTQLNQPPAAQQLARMQQDYFGNIPETCKDPYNKLMLQGEALEGMKRYREKIADDLSLGTPKPYRNRALSLYNQIAPAIAFNERGELLEHTGTAQQQAILGSRAEDLIQHAVRDRRKQFTPVGWETFVEQLKEHNIPRMTMNRATVEELQKLVPSPATSTTSPPTASTTAATTSTTTTTATTMPPPPPSPLKTSTRRGRPREPKKVLGATGRSKRSSTEKANDGDGKVGKKAAYRSEQTPPPPPLPSPTSTMTQTRGRHRRRPPSAPRSRQTRTDFLSRFGK